MRIVANGICFGIVMLGQIFIVGNEFGNPTKGFKTQKLDYRKVILQYKRK